MKILNLTYAIKKYRARELFKYALIFALLSFTIKLCADVIFMFPALTEILLITCACSIYAAIRYTKKIHQDYSHLLLNLSERETEVFRLLLTRKKNKEISDALFISNSTLKTHINSIYRKLNLKNRKELKQRFCINS